ncbi:MAG: hypothetical protein NZ772_07655 [Cyanobacteria bacterium]|nr:hypothetical protein [Cyanobacteriota bacterium]MDW8201386.1 hypothetical protein [Cyanobacteriota bacterium SKYGB_h_bin112]
MSTQQLPITALQKVRQFIRSGLTVPASENNPPQLSFEDDLPEPESLDALSDLFKFAGVSATTNSRSGATGRWLVSVVNPGAILAKLPGLELKPGWRLVSYLYREADHGLGVCWAVAETHSSTANLEAALVGCKTQDQLPIPEGALGNFMDAITGDRSVRSFAIASMFYREIKEFGALGNLQDWTHHHLIATVPGKVNWQWQGDIPKNLAPKVRTFPDGRAALEFFTCRVVAPIAIYRHIDLYLPDSYRANGMSQAIATV